MCPTAGTPCPGDLCLQPGSPGMLQAVLPPSSARSQQRVDGTGAQPQCWGAGHRAQPWGTPCPHSDALGCPSPSGLLRGEHHPRFQAGGFLSMPASFGSKDLEVLLWDPRGSEVSPRVKHGDREGAAAGMGPRDFPRVLQQCGEPSQRCQWRRSCQDQARVHHGPVGERLPGQAGCQAGATEPAGRAAPAGATPGITALTRGHDEPSMHAQHESPGALIPCTAAPMQVAVLGFLCYSPQSWLATGLTLPQESRRSSVHQPGVSAVCSRRRRSRNQLTHRA